LQEAWRGSNALKFSKNGNIIVSGSADQTMKVWDLSLKKEVRKEAPRDHIGSGCQSR